jgi:hypothetical protein
MEKDDCKGITSLYRGTAISTQYGGPSNPWYDIYLHNTNTVNQVITDAAYNTAQTASRKISWNLSASNPSFTSYLKPDFNSLATAGSLGSTTPSVLVSNAQYINENTLPYEVKFDTFIDAFKMCDTLSYNVYFTHPELATATTVSISVWNAQTNSYMPGTVPGGYGNRAICRGITKLPTIGAKSADMCV